MDQSFMKEKAVMPLVISMAIPMTISMLVNSLYNIIDSFYVAKISEQAMTALSLVYPAQNLLTAVTVGFAIGVNAVTECLPWAMLRECRYAMRIFFTSSLGKTLSC